MTVRFPPLPHPGPFGMSRRWAGASLLALAVALGGQAPSIAQPDASGPAWSFGRPSYKAFAAGDNNEAVDKVRSALALAPDVVRCALLLIDVLIAAGRLQRRKLPYSKRRHLVSPTHGSRNAPPKSRTA